MKKSKKKGAALAESVPAMKPDQDYETQNHLDTLHRAADVLADEDKMAKVHKLAGRRHKALAHLLGKGKKKITSVAELRAHANMKKEEDME